MKKKQNKLFGRDISDMLLNIVKYIVLAVFVFVCIYPFYYVIIYSLSDSVLAATGVYLWPKGFTLESYREILELNYLPRAFCVSIIRTVLGTLITVFFTTMLAFLVTRKEMMGRKVVYRFIVITMYLDAGLIPWYLTMRTYGFKDTFLLYIIPGAIHAYYMILIKTFLEQIPESMEESAAIEGAGFFNIFFKIIVPLSKPIIATISVYCAVGQWNSWRDNFFLNSKSNLQTVQLILHRYLTQTEELMKLMESGAVTADVSMANMVTPETVQMTSVVVTMVPVMLVYPFAQKYFTKGIMMGAVKG